MSNYNPKHVEIGTRDFILHKTGTAPESVAVHSQGFGYVVEVKQGSSKIPDDLVEQLRRILPDDYRLELE